MKYIGIQYSRSESKLLQKIMNEINHLHILIKSEINGK